MDFLSALRVSASGLSAQRTRINAATSNLANAETTRGPDGLPYRRMDPVLESTAFGAEISSAMGSSGGPVGVRVAEMHRDETAGRRVFSPHHPDADADGYVVLPNVEPVHEMVNLMSASRGYEANSSAVETLKTMAQRALDILR